MSESASPRRALTLVASLTSLTSSDPRNRCLMPAALLDRWSLQDAKAKFSEIVRRALTAGPQLVMRGREEAVVIIAAHEYQRLIAPRQSLALVLANSPLSDVTLDIARPADPGRDVEL